MERRLARCLGHRNCFNMELDSLCMRVERFVPFRKYSGFEISALLDVLREGVESGSSQTTVFFGEFAPRTLTLPRGQTILDVNLEECKRRNIPVVYVPRGAKAFLNTPRELYFAVVGKTSAERPLDISSHYQFVGEKLAATFESLGLAAKGVARVIDGTMYGHDVKMRDGFDVKLSANVSDPYYVGMLAALASVHQGARVFARHGAVFFDRYTPGEVREMVEVMNAPKKLDTEAVVDRIMKYPSFVSNHVKVSREEFCARVAMEFGAKEGVWSDFEWSAVQKKVADAKEAIARGEYYKDEGVVKSMGLCMYNWGEKFRARNAF